MPNDPAAAPELEAIANKLIAEADVNKQVLPSIPKELVEYVHSNRCHSISVLMLLITLRSLFAGGWDDVIYRSWFVDTLRTLSTTAAHEISPVCAVVGGLLAQDILKALAAREPPIANFFTFDGNLGGGTVVRMGMP